MLIETKPTKPSSTRQVMTALIYDKRGRVLSIGQNSYVKTHPMQARLAMQAGEGYKIFLHAEIHAITRCRDLSKAHRISVFRYDRQGKPALAKPCEICASAIKQAGIRLVEHT
jgi:tRNA(Arg) A34 adenosine deaminase TadA